MTGRIIAGVIGFVVLVLLVQNYVLGGSDGDDGSVALSGAAPTATPPAQLPDPILLGSTGAEGTEGNGTAGGTSNGGSDTYVVQSGDTLGTIAASFNVPPEAQAAWINEVLELNGIADARTLQAGQELQVPATSATASETPGAPTGSTGPGPGIATATPTSAAGSGGTYVIQSGDTPYDIAAAFCVESPASWVDELVELNGINPNNLTVGEELTLPDGTPAQCQ